VRITVGILFTTYQQINYQTSTVIKV